ncbi:MAG: ADOP family duplicated permease [Vicinamibacterales bacterium]
MTFDRLRHIVRLRFRSLWLGHAVDRELDEELRFHLDQQIAANIAGGMTAPQARTAALRAIGGVEQRKEECRDTRGIAVAEHLVRDLRLAWRQLRKQPAFTLAAVLSLGLGIGANSAMFQLLNALTMRPLPVPHPEELVEVRLTGNGRDGRHNGRNRQVSLPQYEEIVRRQQAFSAMLAFGDSRFNLSPQGEVRYVDGLFVSGSFFETLGLKPLLGRFIDAGDDRPGCGEPVAVISHALWQREFGGRADIVGQTVSDGLTRVPVIGVAPAAFFGVEVGRQFGMAMPNCWARRTGRDHWWLAAIGRLKPGWTIAQAEAHLKGLMPGIQRDTMPEYRASLAGEYLDMSAEVVSAAAGVSPLRRSYERPLWVLMGIAALVLLIASVNLANLLLARATARSQEFAVRLALGGSRGRVLQQVFAESALIAAVGAVAAIGVAMLVSRSIPPLISTAVDQIYLDLAIDWRVFGFTALAGAGTALLFGMAPAIKAARSPVMQVSGRGAAANRGLGLRRGLVAAQIAVTLVLLFGGLLFLRSLQNLSTQDTGVSQRNVMVATLFFNEAAYPMERRAAAYRAMDERVQALPGVISVAEAYTTPLGGSTWDTDVEIDGKVAGGSNVNRVSPGYFATLGAPLLAGRDFDERDVPGAPRVAIVTASFAAKFFGGDAIGKHFIRPSDTGEAGTDYQIVGIVADQKYDDIRENGTRIYFLASSQDVAPPAYRRYVIRSSESPAQLMAAVGRAVAAIDPTIGLRYAMLDTQLSDAMLRDRLMARLSVIFGAVALLLAAVGLYGVVSYTVATRRAEIGVRVALGASGPRILAMVLGDVGRMLALGVAAGAVVAVLAARMVASLLFGLPPDDPATLAMAVGVLTVAGLLAAVWPARRAAGIDPVSALRES